MQNHLTQTIQNNFKKLYKQSEQQWKPSKKSTETFENFTKTLNTIVKFSKSPAGGFLDAFKKVKQKVAASCRSNQLVGPFRESKFKSRIKQVAVKGFYCFICFLLCLRALIA